MNAVHMFLLYMAKVQARQVSAPGIPRVVPRRGKVGGGECYAGGRTEWHPESVQVREQVVAGGVPVRS